MMQVSLESILETMRSQAKNPTETSFKTYRKHKVQSRVTRNKLGNVKYVSTGLKTNMTCA